MGVVSLLNSILVLLIIPFVFQNDKLTKIFIYSHYHKFLFWLFFFNCLVLGWIGGKSIETPYYEIGQIATVFYFLYFFILIFFDFLRNPFLILARKISVVNLASYLEERKFFDKSVFVPFHQNKIESHFMYLKKRYFLSKLMLWYYKLITTSGFSNRNVSDYFYSQILSLIKSKKKW
jgi:hypothetical protein